MCAHFNTFFKEYFRAILHFVKKIFFVHLILGISLILNVFLLVKNKDKKPLSEIQVEYPFLASRILNENPNDLIINFVPLRKILREKTSEWGDTFAMYFEYLPTGVSIGVREKEEYNPQSLIKVPIVMAYYHHYRERLGIDLDSEEVVIKESQIDNRSGSLWSKGAGSTVTLKEVVNATLTESDNTSTNILADYVPLEDYKVIYEGLDIDFPERNEDLRLSVKQYSSIKRSLYLSSILSNQDSQEILDILTKTIFNNKLPAGVPSDIPVSHKVAYFGENLQKDCGIVYVPHRPYLLCMISESSDEEAIERMSTISKIVYEYVVGVNGGGTK